MRVLHAHNYHRSRWGQDNAWAKTVRLSQQSGLEVRIFSRDSKALPSGLRGNARAFFSGLYAPTAIEDFSQTLARFRPDVVHTHQLYPLISPWILRCCTSAGVPVVHTCYDFRLTCPIATHFVKGAVCYRCAGGKEYWAVVNNCRNHLAESLGYALRNGVARHFRLFADHVGQFIVLSEFGRQWLIRWLGVDPGRIAVQPCVIPLPPSATDPAQGRYIAYAGRFAPEKGVELVIEAARRTGLPVRLAGNEPAHPAIRQGDPVECVLTSSPGDLAGFYRGARFLVVPSLWQEPFGVVAAEAMSHGVPVLAARIGGLTDPVSDGVTGLLFEPGNIDQLARAMRRLWDDPALCCKLGAAARLRVETKFDEGSHIRILLEAYRRAVAGKMGPQRLVPTEPDDNSLLRLQGFLFAGKNSLFCAPTNCF
jgi:glycosyltransferase involved in cell wall biosynthesis